MTVVEEFARLAGPSKACLICQGAAGDAALRRVPVWEDRLWRLTTSLYSEVPGFSYLEPKRHIPYLADLDGQEAATLGPVLARAADTIRTVTGAPLVYVLVLGGRIPHVHFHLAPSLPEGAWNLDLIRPGTPLVPESELREVAERIRAALRKPTAQRASTVTGASSRSRRASRGTRRPAGRPRRSSRSS